MKLNSEYILRKVADTYIVLPVGQATVKFNGMLTLNESAALIWKMLEQSRENDEIVSVLVEEYGITAENAKIDIEDFIADLTRIGCIDA